MVSLRDLTAAQAALWGGLTNVWKKIIYFYCVKADTDKAILHKMCLNTAQFLFQNNELLQKYIEAVSSSSPLRLAADAKF